MTLVGDIETRLLEDAAARVASWVLGRSADEVRGDRRAWQVTFWSEHFDEVFLPQIDWRSLSSDVAGLAERHPSRPRGDFDLASSSMWAPSLLDRDDIDRALRGFLEVEPMLLGTQIRALIGDGRLDARWLRGLEGRVRASSGGLLDTVRALLLLHDPAITLAVPRRQAELDSAHAELIAQIEPRELGAHVGLFFQTPYAARSEGMFFETSAMREHMRQHLASSLGVTLEPAPEERDRATWRDGEGLRTVHLALQGPAPRSVPPKAP